MRTYRTATVLTLAAMLAAATLAEARILGSRSPRKSDCYLYFEGINATSNGNKVECHDNDTCDSDGGTAKQCAFTFTACFNATDVAGCTPGTVTKVKPTKKAHTTINYPPLNVPGQACASTPTTVVLKLRNNGKPTTATINFKADSTAKPKVDNDRLILKCLASPSGAFVMIGEE